MNPRLLLTIPFLIITLLPSQASESSALLAAKTFHTTFPTCGKSVSMPLDLVAPNGPNSAVEPPKNFPQTLINTAKYSFYNTTKDPERFEMRKIQYDGANYLKTLLEEEIYWLGPKSQWSPAQTQTFEALIKELTKLSENTQTTAYVGRFNIEPEVNSYFYCELNLKEQCLKMEVFQRCD